MNELNFSGFSAPIKIENSFASSLFTDAFDKENYKICCKSDIWGVVV